MTGRTTLRVLLLLQLCAAVLHAQEELQFNPQAEDLFLAGMRQFVQQDFKSAYQALRQSADIAPMHQRTTAAMIMAAKSANALRMYDEAADLCRTFLERYPYSSYVEDAHYTLGMAYAGLARMRDAAQEMIVTAGTAHVDATRWRAQERLEQYSVSFTPAVVGMLESEARDDSTRALLMLIKGEAYVRRGMKDSAAAAVQNLAASTADRKLLRRAQRLIRRDTVLTSGGDTLTVGVLLPLMNHYRVAMPEGETSKEILRGVNEALREYNTSGRGAHEPVKLDVRDTQRKKERIDGIIDEWKNDPGVVAILGPLFTDETTAAAAKANASRIPLLTPTATGNNIASIGEYVFQANPDYEMRGALMAQYAVLTAGAKNLAVITSDAFPASQLGDAFAKEVHRLGADLVSYQHYESGTTDFRQIMKAIRTEASEGRRGGIDAVYCPIASPSEIGVIAPQIRMLGPKVMVLGSDEWNDDEQLDRNKTSADGVIFPSDRWNSDPSHPISGLSFESFGYDGASLLFACIGPSAGSRDSLRSVLSRVSEYDGVHSKISLQPSRVNTHLHILQYSGGFIKKIGEVEYRQ